MDLNELKYVVGIEGNRPSAAFHSKVDAEGYMTREARRNPYLKYYLYNKVEKTTVEFMYDPEIGEFTTV